MSSHTVKILIFIVGAQIIDLMLLVVDVTKGIQTQTAEVSHIYNDNVFSHSDTHTHTHT